MEALRLTPHQGISLRDLLAQVQQAVSKVPRGQWVRAEIAQMSKKNGHVWLELVEHDEEGKRSAKALAVIWKSVTTALLGRFRKETAGELEPGLKVLIQVDPEFRPLYGFLLHVRDIDPAFTLGDLEARRRQILEFLSRQGILERNRRLPKPSDFFRVAVVSPENSAGLGDFLREARVLQEHGLCRFEYRTATFQGEQAASSILEALRDLRDIQNGSGFDALCLIRGGGSAVDLAWLDHQDLAKAVCLFPIPVFTGIGHERDNTILDEVANTRFDTPSKVIGHIQSTIRGNAEQADGNFREISNIIGKRLAEAEHEVDALFATLDQSSRSVLSREESMLEKGMECIRRLAEQALHLASSDTDNRYRQIVDDAVNLLLGAEQELERLRQEVPHHASRWIERAERDATALVREILGQGPEATLKRGFALVRDETGRPVSSAEKAQRSSLLELEFRDGITHAIPMQQK